MGRLPGCRINANCSYLNLYHDFARCHHIPKCNAKVLGFGFAPLLHVGDGCGPLGRVDRSARVTVGHPPWMDKASSRVARLD